MFSKLKIPAKLQESLPFASKSKQDRPLNPKSYLARRSVIVDDGERKERAMLQQLSTIRKGKETKREQAKSRSRQEKLAGKARESAKFSDVHKDKRSVSLRNKAWSSRRGLSPFVKSLKYFKINFVG